MIQYITGKEISEKWNISERMVRKYCESKRIPNAYLDGKTWYIPADANKPGRKTEKIQHRPKLLIKILNQRNGRNYRGLYEYLQINMTYSNNRMASSRLTRNQIELIYRKDKIKTADEAIKINDVIEARNHISCVDVMLDSAMTALTINYAEQLQKALVSEVCGHRRHEPTTTGLRKNKVPGTFVEPGKIRNELKRLFSEYEALERVELDDILNLHVGFERIRPFEDCNGRVGRFIMLKECLRHGITPFIIDDKRRKGYLDGLRCWEKDKSILMGVCLEAQQRFADQIELQKLHASHNRMMDELGMNTAENELIKLCDSLR